jgi:hypothetical protein
MKCTKGVFGTKGPEEVGKQITLVIDENRKAQENIIV